MQQDDTDSAQDPAVYSATVTHIGLPTGFTAHLLQEDRRAGDVRLRLTFLSRSIGRRRLRY